MNKFRLPKWLYTIFGVSTRTYTKGDMERAFNCGACYGIDYTLKVDTRDNSQWIENRPAFTEWHKKEYGC